MDEYELPMQEDDKTYVSEIKLNKLMLRLGFHWNKDAKIWVMDGDISHLAALEALRLYEEDR